MELPPEIENQIAEFSNDPTPEGLRGLQNLCSTNRFLADLCRNDNFWKRLYQRLHPKVTKPPFATWRRSYQILVNSQKIDLMSPEFYKTDFTELLQGLIDVASFQIERDFSVVATDGRLYSFRKGDYIVGVTVVEGHLIIEGHQFAGEWETYLNYRGITDELEDWEVANLMRDDNAPLWYQVVIPLRLTLTLNIL